MCAETNERTDTSLVIALVDGVESTSDSGSATDSASATDSVSASDPVSVSWFDRRMRSTAFWRCAAAAMVAATAAPGHAEPAARKTQVQADLGMTVIGVGLERQVAPQLALGGYVHSLATWFGPWFDRPNLGGVALGVRVTWFPRGTAPTGLYVAGFARMVRASVLADAEGNDAPSDVHAGLTSGAFVGYAWALPAHLSLRLGLGVQYISLAARRNADGREVAFRGPWPGLDAVVGYSF